jgi:hypothetical protein
MFAMEVLYASILLMVLALASGLNDCNPLTPADEALNTTPDTHLSRQVREERSDATSEDMLKAQGQLNRFQHRFSKTTRRHLQKTTARLPQSHESVTISTLITQLRQSGWRSI